jgi:hypothetical protein
LLGDLDDTNSLGQFGSCLAQLVWLGSRTAEALSELAMLRDEVALTFDLILGTLKPGANAITSHPAAPLRLATLLHPQTIAREDAA